MHIIFLHINRMAIISHISYIQHKSVNGNIKLLCVSSKSYTSFYTVFQGKLLFFTVPIFTLDIIRKELLNMYTWASIHIRRASQLLNFYSNFKKMKKFWLTTTMH